MVKRQGMAGWGGVGGGGAGQAGEEIEGGEQKLYILRKTSFISLWSMKSNYSSWPTLILFLHFKFYFLLFFTVLEQELYCCAKSAKKITPDSLWHSSFKKQKANCLVRLAAHCPWSLYLPLLKQETAAAITPLIWGGVVTSAFPVISESASALLPGRALRVVHSSASWGWATCLCWGMVGGGACCD